MKTAIEYLSKTPLWDNIVNMETLKKEFPEKFEESGQMNWKWFEEHIRPNHNCFYRPDKNSFTIQIETGDGKGQTKYDLLNFLQAVFEYYGATSPEEAMRGKNKEIATELHVLLKKHDELKA